jgi:hypothetical protein
MTSGLTISQAAAFAGVTADPALYKQGHAVERGINKLKL